MKATKALAVMLVMLVSPIDTAAGTCSDLLALKLPDVRIMEAVALADSASLSKRVKVPHCKVSGVIGREIRFEAQLPDAWNGRFFMGGGGGFVGSIQNSALSTVNDGYATIGTDTGHRGRGAEWALDHPERQVNFGHLAIHRTAEVGKALIRAHYGKGPEYSYFKGCSRGGGQAMIEAQRYPDDFDGIIAGAPAQAWPAFGAEFVQNIKLNFPDPEKLDTPVVTRANLELLERSVLGECDELDGVLDGVMEDPRDCSFDPTSLPVCEDGQLGPDCVSEQQRDAIAAVYDPVLNSRGQIHPGQPFGSEVDGWSDWITGLNKGLYEDSGYPSLQFYFAVEFFKYFVYEDPNWDYRTFDVESFEKDTRFVSRMLDSTDPDLSAFKAHGGKLIVWHGWSDAALSALVSIAYYETVEQLDPDVRDYFRFYLLPGVRHCGRGPGPNRVDWDKAIVDWVENGIAPGMQVASKREDGKVTMTRPVCVYPERAVYDGVGPTDSAESFSCREP